MSLPRCLTGSRLGRRFYEVGSEVIVDLLSDVLRVALDLADVPALHGRPEGDPYNERKRDPLSGPLRQQEVVVTGVEDVHGRTISPTADILWGRVVKVHGNAVNDKVPRTGDGKTQGAERRCRCLAVPDGSDQRRLRMLSVEVFFAIPMSMSSVC